jgi:hypothetical protein
MREIERAFRLDWRTCWVTAWGESDWRRGLVAEQAEQGAAAMEEMAPGELCARPGPATSPLGGPSARADVATGKESLARRAILERLLAAWDKAPDWRLGKLITNAVGASVPDRTDIKERGRVLFKIEDEGLVEMLERFVSPKEKS